MTTEERFERIESGLAEIVTIQRRQAESSELMTQSMSQLTQMISHYVDSADARMKRIEENLDGLIRAITAEHTNGKNKH